MAHVAFGGIDVFFTLLWQGQIRNQLVSEQLSSKEPKQNLVKIANVRSIGNCFLHSKIAIM